MLTDKFSAGSCTLSQSAKHSLPSMYAAPGGMSLPLLPLSNSSKNVHLLYKPEKAASPRHSMDNAKCLCTQKSFLPKLSSCVVSPRSERCCFALKTHKNFSVFIIFLQNLFNSFSFRGFIFTWNTTSWRY